MKKIMVVDDEAISLMMTDNILSTEYQTVCASSGREAMDLYHKERPDMVLSDLRMPEMSGFELQQNLQEEFHEQIPFMFMTADKDDETESKGFANGAQDFIRKPFRPDVLLRRVGNILQTVETIQGLQKAADTDPMTGLLNKASAQEEIGVVCKSTPGVLLMIDLDSFKLVNDIYGHAAGDKILIRFSEIIQSAVRSTDIVGRMGGDEFIAYCQHIKDEAVIAKKAAFINERILAAAKEIMGDDMAIPLGASIGCVFAPEEGTDFAALYKKADKALYVVKQNGKHGYSCYKEASAGAGEETPAATDLPAALKILSERNQSAGAFVVSFEQFRTIFQFMARVLGNYKKEVWLLLFSLGEPQKGAAYAPAQAAEDFLAVLRSSLRQSDVVAQNGKNQFMVLLLETAPDDIAIVTERIARKWAETGGGTEYALTYELEAMK